MQIIPRYRLPQTQDIALKGGGGKAGKVLF